MMNALLQLPSGLFVIIFSSIITGVFIIGLHFKLKYSTDFYISHKDNPSVNILFYLISTLLTILLAFILITVWHDYEEQQRKTGEEACVLGNLYRDARGLDSRIENDIQGLIINYTREVVEDGWSGLEEERESQKAWTAFNQLYGKVIRINPENKKEEMVFGKMIIHMNDLAAFRRLRIIRSQTPVLPVILKWSIILATLVTVIFTYLIRVQNKNIERIMIGLVGGMLGLVFSLIILFNSPYKGAMKIKPFPLENLLNDVFPMADITQAKK